MATTLKLATTPGSGRLAQLSLALILAAAALCFVALQGWGGVPLAPATACPSCPAAAADCLPAPGGSQSYPPPHQGAQEQPPPEQQQSAGQPGGRSAGDADGTPMLCGGPEAIPHVAEALAESSRLLWPNARDALQPWEAGYTDDDLAATAQMLHFDGRGQGDVHMTAEVRDKQVVFPHQGGACAGCNPAVFILKEGLDAGMAAGRLAIPEGLPMLWNVQDQSTCSNRRVEFSPCKAPLFSVFKIRDDIDVLMPHFKPRTLEPHFVPWEQKRPLAFFRRAPGCTGAPICSYIPLNGSLGSLPSRNCSRWAIAELSWRHPELLNCTLTVNVTQYGGPDFVPGPETSHEEQTWYKYLVNADGSTAAWRLATLLMKNSLVVKQASPRVEWYYSAVQPCVHYIHYWVTSEEDLVGIVRALNASPQNQLMAQRVAANGQAFAHAHLTQEAQWQYWQLLIDRYAELYRGPGGNTTGAGGQAQAADGASAADAAAAGAEAAGQAAEQPREAAAGPAAQPGQQADAVNPGGS